MRVYDDGHAVDLTRDSEGNVTIDTKVDNIPIRGVVTKEGLFVPRPKIIEPGERTKDLVERLKFIDALAEQRIAGIHLNSRDPDSEVDIRKNENGIAVVNYTPHKAPKESEPSKLVGIAKEAYRITKAVLTSRPAKAAAAVVLVAMSGCGFSQTATASVAGDDTALIRGADGIYRPPVNYRPEEVLRRASDIIALTKGDGIARPLFEREALTAFYGLAVGEDNEEGYLMHTPRLRIRKALGPIAVEALIGGNYGRVDDEMDFDVTGLELFLQFMKGREGNRFVYLNAGVVGDFSDYDSRIGVEHSEILAPYIELGAGKKDAWRAGIRGFNTDTASINDEFEHGAIQGDHPAGGIGLYYDQRLGKVWLLMDYNHFRGEWPGLIPEYEQHIGSLEVAIPFGPSGRYSKALNYFSLGVVPSRTTDLAGDFEDEVQARIGWYLTKGRTIFSITGNSDFENDNFIGIMLGWGSPLGHYLDNP